MKQKIDLKETQTEILQPGDINDIMDIQQKAFDVMENTQTLRRNTIETFSVCFEAPSIGYAIKYQGKMIAFGILYCAGTDKENLAWEAGYSEADLNTVANVKVIIVLPDFRGNGLQRYLIQRLEEHAKALNIKTLMSTVSPLNQYSMHNFEACGFEKLKTVVKYGGLSRVLFVKQL